MDLRDGMATMSLTGELAATPLPGVDPTTRRVPPPAAQPAGLGAPRLRDGAPDGAAGARPHLGRVLLVVAARRRRLGARRRRRRGVLGHHQQAGLGGLRVGAARAGQPALPPRAVRARTRTPSPHLVDRGSVAPTSCGPARAVSRARAARRGAAVSRSLRRGRPPASSQPTAAAAGRRRSPRRADPGRLPHAAPVRRRAARALRLDPAALGAGQPGGRARCGSGFAFVPGPDTQAGARHGGAARGRPRLQHDRHRRRLRRDVRPAARPAQPAARRPARHRPLRADQLPRAAEPHASPTTSPPAGAAARSAPAPTTTRPRCPPTTSPR